VYSLQLLIGKSLRRLKMDSIELAETICKRCNEFSLASKIHVPNVVYVPENMIKGIYSWDNNIWNIDKINCKNKILKLKIADDITIFVKKRLKTEICVAYMKDVYDEMPEVEMVETVDLNLIEEYREAMKWKNETMKRDPNFKCPA
jgi:hypothetical protein